MFFFGRKEKSDQIIQTFTYYIPSPPPRKVGFREKEFDTITSEILGRGISIISAHMQANNPISNQMNMDSRGNLQPSGVWIMLILKGTIPQIEKLNSDLYLNNDNL